MLFTKDFIGIVLKNNLKGIEIAKEDDTHVYVKVAAGEVWHEFVMHCITSKMSSVSKDTKLCGEVA